LVRDSGPEKAAAPAAGRPALAEAVPENAGALPVLSVVGFGTLFGGIVSALKTRSR
jgi:hypothetical protein